MYTDNLDNPNIIRYDSIPFKRYSAINYLIDKYNLVNYLEIGIFHGENIREVKASHKDGVDPGAEGVVVPEVNYPMTSDGFFELIKGHDDIKYDIIFIDGLHHSDQVAKDIANSLNHLVENGFIVMHDCNPISYEAQKVPRETVAWNGDTWKAFVSFKHNNPTYECCVIDADYGVGVIKNNGTSPEPYTDSFTWEQFESNKKELLNLITPDEFKATY
jgi:hypothetical protein